MGIQPVASDAVSSTIFDASIVWIFLLGATGSPAPNLPQLVRRPDVPFAMTCRLCYILNYKDYA
jgi:hypothetical protein